MTPEVPSLPELLQQQLAHFGIINYDEITLRQMLEAHTTTYTLIKLADWPARRWKCHYRLMMSEGIYDAQNVPEAYALALLALLRQKAPSTESGRS